MKRLFVLATVVVLLALMVSSVSAQHVVPPDVNGVGVANVVIEPPTLPESASDGEDRPTDEVSLNGGSTITIIVVDN